MRLLTHSRMASYRGCPRKHYYQYILRRRAIKIAHALAFGILIHRCLERYWKSRQQGLGEQACTDAALKPLSEEMDPFDRAKAYAMVLCYLSLWDLTACEVLAVEKTFQFPLTNPHTGLVSNRWMIAGKIDLILRVQDRVKIIEHKSTSNEVEPGGGYRQRTLINSQISHYLLGGQAMGFAAHELIYDVLRKPRQKPLQSTPVQKQVRVKKTGALRKGQREFPETAEEYGKRIAAVMEKAPDQYIVRLECQRTTAHQKRYYLNMWQWSEAMDRAERSDVHPQNDDHCWMYDQPCEYWDVCTGIAGIDDPTRFRNTTSTNEELEEVEVP